jgi:quercetin dioxygenase-like cupin family protein
MKKTIIFTLFAITLIFNAYAKQVPATKPVQAEILHTSTRSWEKSDYQYPSGDAKISIQKITVTPGDKPLSLSMHCHNMPLAAYVLSGEVKVVKESGQEQSFIAGNAFIEMMNSWHKGVFAKKTELIVFYASSSDLPLSVKKDGDAKLASLCK